jgi:hypothetical protein
MIGHPCWGSNWTAALWARKGWQYNCHPND